MQIWKSADIFTFTLKQLKYTHLTQNLHIFDQRKQIMDNSWENIQPNKTIMKLLSP